MGVDTLDSLMTTQFADGGGIINIIGLLPNMLSLAMSVLVIIGYWKIFAKAGEEGWKSLIPFYNLYIILKISKKPKWWLIMMIVGSVLGSILMMAGITFLLIGIGSAFAGSGADASLLTIGIVLLLISGAALITTFVFNCLMMSGLAKAFGQGAGITVGLILLPYVFVPVLGLGSYRYVLGGEGDKKEIVEVIEEIVVE